MRSRDFVQEIVLIELIEVAKQFQEQGALVVVGGYGLPRCSPVASTRSFIDVASWPRAQNARIARSGNPVSS
jgi:hypothetical protein